MLRPRHVLWALATVLPACFSPDGGMLIGSTGEGTCEGSEGCPCFPNDTCLTTDLVCEQGTCVADSPDGTSSSTPDDSTTTATSPDDDPSDPSTTGDPTVGGSTGGEGGSTGEPSIPCDGTLADFRHGDFSSADEWTLGNGIDIVGGHLEVSGAAVCFDETATQSACIPRFDDLQGPAAVMLSVPVMDWSGCGPECFAPRVSVSYGPEPTLADPFAGTGPDVPVCLGDAAYGGDTEISLGAAGTCPSPSVSFDSVRLQSVEPHKCPRPGEVLNGSFDQALDMGWEDISGGGAFYVFDQGGGDGAGVLEIFSGTCNDARVRGRFAPPSGIEHPSLRFSAYSSGPSLELTTTVVDTAGYNPQSTFIHPGPQYYVVCLDDNLAGGAYTVEFDVYGGGLCSAVVGGSVTLDDISIADSPFECP